MADPYAHGAEDYADHLQPVNIIDTLRHRFRDSKTRARQSGSDYDIGYSDALGEILEHMTGDAASCLTPSVSSHDCHTTQGE